MTGHTDGERVMPLLKKPRGLCEKLVPSWTARNATQVQGAVVFFIETSQHLHILADGTGARLCCLERLLGEVQDLGSWLFDLGDSMLIVRKKTRQNMSKPQQRKRAVKSFYAQRYSETLRGSRRASRE